MIPMKRDSELSDSFVTDKALFIARIQTC
jgi:hypothetical protein